MKKIVSAIMSMVVAICAFTITGNTDIIKAQAATYEQQLINKGFPKSYTQELVKLHNKYPNWDFEPLKTGLDWNNAVSGERRNHRQQLIENVTSLYPTSYFCQCSNCYRNGKYIVMEGPNWVSASKTGVEYYMDPRNFLDEKHIFQFESTAYNSAQTQSGVEAILSGTWMHNSTISYKDKNGKTQTINEKYSSVIMTAAKTYNMSAYYLASKIVQEVGRKEPTAGGAYGTNKTYPGIYNYYNIGAYTGYLDGLKWASTSTASYYVNGGGSKVNIRKEPVSGTVITSLPSGTKVTYVSSTSKQSDGYIWHQISFTYSGVSYKGYIRNDLLGHSQDTYGRPWTSPKQSILYGAKYISNNFKTQTSGYLQKFNVNPASPYLHSNEYMANVAAAAREAEKTYSAYNKIDKLSAAKTFQIPVFNDMSDKDAPPATSFTYVMGIENGFDLHWNKVDETTGYQIQYSTRSDFEGGAYVYGGPKDTLGITITGRAKNTKYYVRVRTYKTISSDYRIWGAWSPVKAVTTTSVQSPPSAIPITSLSADIAHGFKVNWLTVSDAHGYEIQYSTRTDFQGCGSIEVSSGKTSHCNITGRADGTKYNVRVRAYKIIDGEKSYGDFGSYVSATTIAKPTTAVISSAQSTVGGVKLNWGKVSETTGYQVQYAKNADFSDAVTLYAGPTDTTSFTVNNLDLYKKYYFRVRTYKNIKNEYVWGVWSDSVYGYAKPSANKLTSAVGVANGFDLYWSKVDETTGYQIQYSTRSDFEGGAYVYGGPTDTLSTTITGRAKNTKYYVRVRTYITIDSDTRIWGDWSNTVEVNTTSAQSAPSATNVISASPEIAHGFKVNWRTISDADGYEIQYSTRTDFQGCGSVEVNSGKTAECNITGRADGTKYYIRVRAYKNINGKKVYGSAGPYIAATTIAKPKTAGIASVSGIQNGFTVKWNKISETTGYQVQFSTRSDFVGAKTVYAGPTDTTSSTITGRASKTKYYVRIRTYKNIKNEYVWGVWSEAKAVTTK